MRKEIRTRMSSMEHIHSNQCIEPSAWCKFQSQTFSAMIFVTNLLNTTILSEVENSNQESLTQP